LTRCPILVRMDSAAFFDAFPDRMLRRLPSPALNWSVRLPLRPCGGSPSYHHRPLGTPAPAAGPSEGAGAGGAPEEDKERDIRGRGEHPPDRLARAHLQAGDERRGAVRRGVRRHLKQDRSCRRSCRPPPPRTRRRGTRRSAGPNPAARSSARRPSPGRASGRRSRPGSAAPGRRPGPGRPRFPGRRSADQVLGDGHGPPPVGRLSHPAGVVPEGSPDPRPGQRCRALAGRPAGGPSRVAAAGWPGRRRSAA
jgi:hypothetical protein